MDVACGCESQLLIAPTRRRPANAVTASLHVVPERNRPIGDSVVIHFRPSQSQWPSGDSFPTEPNPLSLLPALGYVPRTRLPIQYALRTDFVPVPICLYGQGLCHVFGQHQLV